MNIRYDKEVYQGVKVMKITSIGGPRVYPLGYTEKPGAIWYDGANNLMSRDAYGCGFLFASCGIRYTDARFDLMLSKLDAAKSIYEDSKREELEKWREKDLLYSWEVNE